MLKYSTKYVGFLLIPLLLNSCSIFSFFSSESKPQKSNYKIKFIHQNWSEIPPENSDRAFLSKKNGDIILANSFCHEYQDTPLDILSERALKGIEGLEYINRRTVTLLEREAHEIMAKGKLDGVKIYLKLLNYRRNECYYDFLFISQYQLNQDSEKIFIKFIDSIEF